MTGEITLCGLVLPVGGIREKALAARRHGIKTFILPALNEPDLAELPEEVRRDMTFVPVETLEEVLSVALERDSAVAVDTWQQRRLLHLRPRLRPCLALDRGHQRDPGQTPDTRIGVRTSAPRWLFDLTVRGMSLTAPLECDTGVVQIGRLTLDEADSIRRAAAFHSDLVTRAASETRRCASSARG